MSEKGTTATINFCTEFNVGHQSFFTTFGTTTSVYSAEIYAGEYTVIPKTSGQILKTKNLIMTDDVTVNAIPYYQVENPSSGDTVYIGSEVIL